MTCNCTNWVGIKRNKKGKNICTGCGREKMNKDMSIPLVKILKDIKDDIQQINQWRQHIEVDWAQSVAEYSAKAEALIELLEAHLFGSVGGFGPEQIDKSLEGRYNYLVIYIYEKRRKRK